MPWDYSLISTVKVFGIGNNLNCNLPIIVLKLLHCIIHSSLISFSVLELYDVPIFWLESDIYSSRTCLKLARPALGVYLLCGELAFLIYFIFWIYFLNDPRRFRLFVKFQKMWMYVDSPCFLPIIRFRVTMLLQISKCIVRIFWIPQPVFFA